jgi:glutamine amidotransferase|tara:strand:- start:11325 stop:11942 length:618 start_codon:yes stop_codon:yes gene_type:complete
MQQTVGILNYDVGNIFSLKKILSQFNISILMVNCEEDFKKCDKIILPGQGSYDHALVSMKKRSLLYSLKDFIKSGNYVLGICLGMQLLMTDSEEGNEQGMDILSGTVLKITNKSKDIKVPNINWLTLDNYNNFSNKLFKKVEKKSFYFAHSYYCPLDNKYNFLTSRYKDLNIMSLLVKNNILCTQFHPELSGSNGNLFFDEFLNI